MPFLSGDNVNKSKKPVLKGDNVNKFKKAFLNARMAVRFFIANTRALLWNKYVDWRNHRLEHKRRHWTAYRINGGGVVPLGKISQSDAIDKCAKFGSVRFVDSPCAVVFYADDLSKS